MARKRSSKRRASARRTAPRRRPAVRRRTIQRDRRTTQLLGRGEGPAGEQAVDARVEGPSEIVSRGGPGARGVGARGHEGPGLPGEDIWEEEEPNAMERREEQGAARAGARPPAGRQSDEALARTIHEILEKDPELDATDIEVAVEGGAVTLTGTVGSRDAKLLAEELVESTPGVREVHNRLRVAR